MSDDEVITVVLAALRLGEPVEAWHVPRMHTTIIVFAGGRLAMATKAFTTIVQRSETFDTKLLRTHFGSPP